MIDILLIVYGAIATLTTMVVVAEHRRINFEGRHRLTRVAAAAVVGLLWPVLVVGALQLGSIAMVARTAHH